MAVSGIIRGIGRLGKTLKKAPAVPKSRVNPSPIGREGVGPARVAQPEFTSTEAARIKKATTGRVMTSTEAEVAKEIRKEGGTATSRLKARKTRKL